MKESARYAKIVEWSEEDQCFVGSSPGLIYGGCHGSYEKAVFEQLCNVVEEAIALYHKDGKPEKPAQLRVFSSDFPIPANALHDAAAIEQVMRKLQE